MPRIPGIANIERSAYSLPVQAYVGKLALVAVFGLLVGCGPKVPNYDYAQEPDPRRSEYVVGVDDGYSAAVCTELKRAAAMLKKAAM